MGGTSIATFRCGCVVEDYHNSSGESVLRMRCCDEHEAQAVSDFIKDLQVAISTANAEASRLEVEIEKQRSDSVETISRNVYMRVLTRLALDNLKNVYPDQAIAESVDAYNRAVTLLEEIEKRQARDWPTLEGEIDEQSIRKTCCSRSS